MGSSGGSSSAQREANRQEDERRQRIAQATASINQAFDNPSRAAQIEDFIAAAREFYTGDLERQRQRDEQQRKFALARTGVTGGSADIDLAKKTAEAFTRGAIEAERRSQGAGANLRAQDQQARLNLISMAQSGLDVGTAARQSAEALRTSLAGARADASQQSLSDVFGQFADLYTESQKRKGEAQAKKYDYGTLYQPSTYGANWNQRAS